jgi:hypothetical protein
MSSGRGRCVAGFHIAAQVINPVRRLGAVKASSS